MGRVALVSLAVLVALAGCNGVSGEDEQDRFTPAPVPTDQPTPTPVPVLAPGLTGEGVVNASALAAAHDSLLENTSFTVRQTVTYRTRNGSPVRRVTSTTRVGRDGQVLVTKRWDGTLDLKREVSYHDGERLLVATTTENATTYYRASPETAALQRSVAVGDEQLERVFFAAETRVIGRAEHDGTTVYHLAPGTRNRSDGTSASQSVSVQAHVMATGFARTYTFRQTLSDEGFGGTAVIVVSTRYSEVGSTAIEQPAWYEKALAKTNATPANRMERSG